MQPIQQSITGKEQHGYWKQIHHHGSIDSPELLTVYQQAVSSAS
jgi:hypothetical protein